MLLGERKWSERKDDNQGKELKISTTKTRTLDQFLNCPFLGSRPKSFIIEGKTSIDRQEGSFAAKKIRNGVKIDRKKTCRPSRCIKTAAALLASRRSTDSSTSRATDNG